MKHPIPKAAIIVIITFFSLSLSAQFTPVTAKNTAYAEIRVGGLKEVWYSASVNYERHLFKENELLTTSLRLGFGGWFNYNAGGREFIGTLQFLIGRNAPRFEIQAGYAYLTGEFTHNPQHKIKEGIPVFIAGFRYQKRDGGFMFKITGGTWGFVNLALGYSF